MRFRKKPVEIEAWQYLQNISAPKPKWLKDAESNGDVREYRQVMIEQGQRWLDAPRLYIKTLEGEMEASINDWIIRGVKGELYPCKPDIFAATYEAVS